MGDADFAADAVADVDGQCRFEGAVAGWVLSYEAADGGYVFSAYFQAEICFEVVEGGLRFDFDWPAAAQAIDRLVAKLAELKLLELFEIFDHRGDHRSVRPG